MNDKKSGHASLAARYFVWKVIVMRTIDVQPSKIIATMTDQKDMIFIKFLLFYS